MEGIRGSGFNLGVQLASESTWYWSANKFHAGAISVSQPVCFRDQGSSEAEEANNLVP